MSHINILPQSVYNRIAAGEVVDRPYSVVKELVENCLDAGATEIEIYIERGGKQLIRVTDNGSGIGYDDLKAAFLPHATSKISCAEDLDVIATLGFRGEALASIAAISRVELTSVVDGASANKITCNGGEIGEIKPAALVKGTDIIVRDLFFNTPVRAKFMKADKKEETDITAFVTRFILGNPDVAFKYYIDGVAVMQSFGGGLEEAMAQVYGAKALPQCFAIDAEKEGVHIYGFIGNQNFFKSNKSYQSVFLNGRYIVNNTIATAVSNAYASYVMKRQFPFYVLNVDVPSDIVDVNVHPNKADVRFIDNRMIFGIVYSVISAVLDGTAKAADFVVDAARIPEIKSTMSESSSTAAEKSGENSIYSTVSKKKIESEPKNQEQQKPDFDALIEKYKPERAYVKPESCSSNSEKEIHREKRADELPLQTFYPKQENFVLSVTDDKMPPDLSKTAAYEILNNYEKEMQQRIEYDEFKYKGNLFNTYLIYEHRDNVYIIDQHAAHERLIYDGLMGKLKTRKVITQPLLCSYVFDTNAGETSFIEQNIPILREIGFEVNPFGLNSFKVDSIPVDLQEINIKDFIDEILANLDELKNIKLEDILKEKLATTACKHAVKGGMRLTDQEIDTLFRMLEGNWGLKCPHGRPVCVNLKKSDIEKMFKRIV